MIKRISATTIGKTKRVTKTGVPIEAIVIPPKDLKKTPIPAPTVAKLIFPPAAADVRPNVPRPATAPMIGPAMA